ncbi:hypothetical protein KCU92_g2520, partial [Aureobasidium melanogenum]|jgi:hypothetical protein
MDGAPTQDSYLRYKTETAVVLEFTSQQAGKPKEKELRLGNCIKIKGQALRAISLNVEIPSYVFISLSISIDLRKDFHAWHTARAEETQDPKEIASNMRHEYFIKLLEYIQYRFRLHRAHLRSHAGLQSTTPQQDPNSFSVLESHNDTDLSEGDFEVLQNTPVKDPGYINDLRDKEEESLKKDAEMDLEMAIYYMNRDMKELCDYTEKLWIQASKGELCITVASRAISTTYTLLNNISDDFVKRFPAVASASAIRESRNHVTELTCHRDLPHFCWPYGDSHVQVMSQHDTDMMCPYGYFALRRLHPKQLNTPDTTLDDAFLRDMRFRQRRGLFCDTLSVQVALYAAQGEHEAPWLPMAIELSRKVFYLMRKAGKLVLETLEKEYEFLRADLKDFKEFYARSSMEDAADFLEPPLEAFTNYLTSPALAKHRESMVEYNCEVLSRIKQERYRQGLTMANLVGVVLASGHLYRSIKATGHNRRDWPDMEKFIEMHGGDTTFKGRSLLLENFAYRSQDDYQRLLHVAFGTTKAAMAVHRNETPFKRILELLCNKKSWAKFGGKALFMNTSVAHAVTTGELDTKVAASTLRTLHTFFDRNYVPTAIQLLKKLVEVEIDDCPAHGLDYVGLAISCMKILKPCTTTFHPTADILWAFDSGKTRFMWDIIEPEIAIYGCHATRMPQALARLMADIGSTRSPKYEEQVTLEGFLEFARASGRHAVVSGSMIILANSEDFKVIMKMLRTKRQLSVKRPSDAEYEEWVDAMRNGLYFG